VGTRGSVQTQIPASLSRLVRVVTLLSKEPRLLSVSSEMVGTTNMIGYESEVND
jgi:hypothetical protein